MTTKPILFSGAMVRALLEGRKTQTRRVVKPQPPAGYEFNGTGPEVTPMPGRVFVSSPYGQPGDGLWVKETWRTWRSLDHCRPMGLAEGAAISYEADGRTNINNHEDGPLLDAGRIRQSIFMRRWMSRITLEITGIRAERLHDISEADALSEGVTDRDPKDPDFQGSAFENYAGLWDTINGAGAWNENPWVWVVEFKRVPRVDQMDRMD